MIIFGGLNHNQVFNDYLILNTVTKMWSKCHISGDIPSPRERCTLTKLNDEMLIMFGGYECSEDETIEINYDDTY
jgi:hypothetical protein